MSEVLYEGNKGVPTTVKHLPLVTTKSEFEITWKEGFQQSMLFEGKGYGRLDTIQVSQKLSDILIGTMGPHRPFVAHDFVLSTVKGYMYCTGFVDSIQFQMGDGIGMQMLVDYIILAISATPKNFNPRYVIYSEYVASESSVNNMSESQELTGNAT